MQQWNECRNILIIRADNMGDLIMSGPAISALKKTFHCRITLLTSTMGSLIASYLPDIDEVIVQNLPWVKLNKTLAPQAFDETVTTIRSKNFDGAVIFTVYSQNPMPAAMLAYMTGIKNVLAYCRENPYDLISDWLPDKEPYDFIQHQVLRDLELVKHIGAVANDDKLRLSLNDTAQKKLMQKLIEKGIDVNGGFIIIHPGVSEKKRAYPVDCWIEAGKQLIKKFGKKLLITGSASEALLTEEIQSGIGENAFSVAGLLNIEELIALIQKASLVVSVNTGTVHIAAAMQTPVVVLYALTNPQHTPWKVPCKVLPFSVQENLKSRNEVVAYVSNLLEKKHVPFATPAAILKAAEELLSGKEKSLNTNIVEH